MFRRDRLTRMWTPLIGPGYANRLAGAYVPLRALVVFYPLWWAVSIVHAVSSAGLRATMGSLDLVFCPVLLGIVSITLVLLHRVRNGIRRSLSERGFESPTRPRILTPSGFRSWLVESGIPAELASEILTAERPATRSERADPA